LAATQGKRFRDATRRTVRRLVKQPAMKAVLTAEELKEVRRRRVSRDYCAQMLHDQPRRHYLLWFTATPKAKTLNCLAATNPSAAGRTTCPPSSVSMRQAIERASSSTCWRTTPATAGVQAGPCGRRWTRKRWNAVRPEGHYAWCGCTLQHLQKCRWCEHFVRRQPLLNGHAKAMVVLGSEWRPYVAVGDQQIIKANDTRFASWSPSRRCTILNRPDAFTETTTR